AEASSGKTGGRLVIAPRRLNASATIPATNSVAAKVRRPVRALAGAGRTAGSDISGHVTALPRRSAISPRPAGRQKHLGRFRQDYLSSRWAESIVGQQ